MIIQYSLKFMLWIKSFHIIFMVTWFAGSVLSSKIVCLPLNGTVDKISLDRFIVMERKLLYGIMTPGGSSYNSIWFLAYVPI